MPLHATTKIFFEFVRRIDIHSKTMNYSTSFFIMNHSLSNITFKEKITNDEILTGLDDTLYSSSIVVELNPRGSFILYSGTNVTIGP